MIQFRMKYSLAIATLLVLPVSNAPAEPPDYSTFGRDQKIHHTADPDRLLRIWLVYIGQGDGILIQFPGSYETQSGDRIELLIDGGPPGSALPVFLDELLGSGVIEYGVLSHHDQDHVAGITSLLNTDRYGISSLYHNGLVSWMPNRMGFEALDVADSDEAVFSLNSARDEITRGMAFLRSDGRRFRADYLIDTRTELTSALGRGDLHNIYRKLAEAVDTKSTPSTVSEFERVTADTPMLPDLPAPSVGDAVRIEPLWPLNPPRKYENSYGSWGYSINGNSVTFRLVYGDFEMLFTGDHNEKSEDELLQFVDETALSADVLKVPHHGSRHSTEDFFDAVNPVVSVASMGKKGFGRSWKHPAEEVIRWAGGSHRIFHTYIHERKFKYAELTDQKKQTMIETTHILVETDGEWFRVVETNSPNEISDPSDVRRGNGTRWIRAADEED